MDFIPATNPLFSASGFFFVRNRLNKWLMLLLILVMVRLFISRGGCLMPKTKKRKVSLHKCQQCQKTFESNRSDSLTCSVRCRQVRHKQELAKRLRSYSITTREEFKEGIVEVLPRMATRYDSAGQLWADFDWSPIPQRQKDLMEIYAVAEGISVDTLQRDFEQTLMAKLGIEIDQKAADRQEERQALVAQITEIREE